MRFKQNYISFLVSGLLMFCFVLSVEAQQNIENITVTVTFNEPPATYSVDKAPLKYNKTFAFSFQVDDGTMDLFTEVFPIFNNLKYTDGCENDRVFTASSSLFCFFQPNENGPDMHDPLDPSYSDNYLTWEFIEDLYNNNYGIYNHGINDNDGTNTSFMDYSIKRNRSYVRRKMYAVTNGGIISNVFATPSQIFEWTQPAFDNGYRLALNKENNGPVGDNGGDVNSSSVNWTNSQHIKRQQAYIVVPVLDYVSALYNQSIDGANYWGSLFTHNINSSQYPQAVFDSDFANIANFYGKDGLDNILLTTDEEIYDYLNIRDAVILNQNLNGNVLTITFSGSVPTNLRYYAMSLVVDTAGVKITSITVDGSMGFSRNINTGLVNFHWDDQIIPDPEFLAESFTAVAETSLEQRDAWIAMDYVHTLPLGEKKVELTNRLCTLDGLLYDDGFCDITIDTIVKISGDTIICLGNTTVLTATAGMQYYEWSNGQSTATISINPSVTTPYWVKGTLNNNTTQDEVTVVVNPIPNIISHSQQSIVHRPNLNDTLWVSTEDESLTYLWDTGGTDSSLIVSPEFTTSYYVDVLNSFECSARQNFEVIIDETFKFIFDSVCFGSTTQLLNTSSYPGSIVSVLWDLDSDGVFDDAEGDEVEHQFTEYGNHLVGMRSLLSEGGIEVVFNVVPVGDFPIVNFLHDNSCIPGITTFDDFSTIIVGENELWNWDFGDGGTDVNSFVSHTYSSSGIYDVKLVVTSSIGCKDSIVKQLSIGESPKFDIINSNGDILNEWDTTVITKNDSLYVTIENASLYDSIIWDNSVRDTEYYVTEEGRFSVEVFDKTCSTTKLGNMSFDGGGGGGGSTTNDIMSLFTPNGDGYNDVWVVIDPNLISPFSVSVYNRYGNLVYSSDNYNNDWLGDYNDTDLPQATYYYIIEDADGEIFKGPITILR